MSYIWDEWSDNEDEVAPRTTISVAKLEQDLESYALDDGADTRTTVSSIGFESFAVKQSSRSSRPPLTTNLSVRSTNTNLEEVAEKVTKLKTDIKTRLEANKSLQAELIRIQTVQERRRVKLEQQYERQLEGIRQDHLNVIKPMEEFHGRISSDLKKLHQQHIDLQQKASHLQEERKLAMENQEKDNIRRLAKQKKQWEIEEKQSVEKAFATKQEMMKKHAADYFAPKLDELVKHNQEKLQVKRQEMISKLEKLKLQYSTENQRKLLSLQQELHEKLPQELAKVTKVHEKRVQQVSQSFQEEEIRIQSLYGKKKELLEQTYHDKMQQEITSFQEISSKIQEKEQKTVTEMTTRQQEEIQHKMISYNEELSKLKHNHKEKVTKVMNILQKKAALQEQYRYEQLVNTITSTIQQQTQAILSQLQSDQTLKLTNVQKEYEEKLMALRCSIDEQLVFITGQEEKSVKRHGEIQSDIQSYRYEITLKEKKTIPHLQTHIQQELQPQVQSLRSLLHALEAELSELKDKLRTDKTAKQTTYEEDLTHVKQTIEELQRKHIQQQDALAQRQQQIEQEQKNELERIQLKIQVVLKKKDGSIETLSEEYQSLQQEHVMLEEQLEELRAKKYA